MAWADLDKLAIAKPRADQRVTLVAADDRPVDQIAETRALSTVVAIARVTRGKRALDERHGGRGVVVYGVRRAPPAFLVDAVTAAGGIVFDGTREHVAPRPAPVTVQLDAAFCDLGSAVRRRLKLAAFRDALDVHEAMLRRQVPREPDAFWTAILELVALAGEALRETRFARWTLADQRLPFALDLGAGRQVFPGQLAQAIVEGGADSLRSLLPLVAAPDARPGAAAPVDVTAARAMPRLCDRTALSLTSIAWTTLVDAEHDHPALPIVAWVEARGDTLRWPPASEAEAFARAALRNIDELAVEITPIALPFATLAVVAGDPFAAETILSPRTMEQVRDVIGGDDTMFVGMPARGHLIAISAARATLDDKLMHAFLNALDREVQGAAEGDRISAMPVVYTTRPTERVQATIGELRQALRAAGVDPDA